MNKEDLIIQYFEKTLSNENQKIFDNLLANDADFAKEFAFQKNLKKAIASNERGKLKQQLQSFENQKTAKKRIKWQYIAASVALFIGGFWFLNKNPDSQELYIQYYQTYPNTTAPAVRGENSDNLKSAAFYEYDSGNFKKAYSLFLNIYTTEKQDYALFYSGLSLIEMNKHQEAIVLLNQFNDTKKNRFTPFVKWFKALSYIKLEQKEKAVVLLQELASNQNPQQDQAKELLAKLK